MRGVLAIGRGGGGALRRAVSAVVLAAFIGSIAWTGRAFAQSTDVHVLLDETVTLPQIWSLQYSLGLFFEPFDGCDGRTAELQVVRSGTVIGWVSVNGEVIVSPADLAGHGGAETLTREITLEETNTVGALLVGRPGDSLQIRVILQNLPPVITGEPETIARTGSPYSFIPSATDPELECGDSLSFSIQNKPDWASFDAGTGALTGTPTNSNVGVYDNIVIAVTDSLGASASLIPFGILVENTNDAPTISGTPAAGVDEDTPYSFTPVVHDDDLIHGDNLTIDYLNLPSWLEANPETGTLSGIPLNENVGTYPGIVATVTDLAGASASLPPFSITVQNTNDSPVFILALEPAALEDGLYVYIPEVIDDDLIHGDHLSFSAQGIPSWLAFNPADGSLAGIPANADVGIHGGIVLTVTDSAGATATIGPLSVSVINVNDAPLISGEPEEFVLEGDSYSFRPVATDDDLVHGDFLIFEILNKPSWLSFDSDTGELTGIPQNEDAGIASGITVSVVDSSGARASLPPFSILVGNVNQGPAISGTPPSEVTEGEIYTFTPAATDVDVPNGDVLGFSVAGLPVWASFTPITGTLNGMPGNGDVGVYEGIVIYVTDSGGLEARLPAFSIIVRNANRAPQISGIPPVSVSQGESYVFQSVLFDEDVQYEDTLTVLGQNIPAWLTLNAQTGMLTGVPENEDVGNYENIALSVKDSGGLESKLAPFSINVLNVNDAPTLAGTPPTSIHEDSEYVFIPSAADPDLGYGDVLTFSAANLPSWATFNTADGGIQGAPGDADVGIYEGIVLSVSDSSGALAKLPVFSIRVINQNDSPEIAGFPPPNVMEGDFYSFLPAANDADLGQGDQLSFSIINKPVWADFSVTTGALTGVPGNSDVGIYSNIIIRVMDKALASRSLPAFFIEVVNVNQPPVISGVPATLVSAGAQYLFVPAAGDEDVIHGDSLAFLIQNKPSWAIFDAGSGELSGTPGSADAGFYSSIQISVQDAGGAVASLAPFSILVQPSQEGDSLITPETGGVVTLMDPESPLNGATVIVPPGAVDESVQLTLGESLIPITPIHAGNDIESPTLEIGPDGLIFNQPVEVRIPVDASFTLSGLDVIAFGIIRSSAAGEVVSTSPLLDADPSDGFVSFLIWHLSSFAVGATPIDPALSSVQIAQPSLEGGKYGVAADSADPITIEVRIVGAGGIPLTCEIQQNSAIYGVVLRAENLDLPYSLTLPSTTGVDPTAEPLGYVGTSTCPGTINDKFVLVTSAATFPPATEPGRIDLKAEVFQISAYDPLADTCVSDSTTCVNLSNLPQNPFVALPPDGPEVLSVNFECDAASPSGVNLIIKTSPLEPVSALGMSREDRFRLVFAPIGQGLGQSISFNELLAGGVPVSFVDTGTITEIHVVAGFGGPITASLSLIDRETGIASSPVMAQQPDPNVACGASPPPVIHSLTYTCPAAGVLQKNYYGTGFFDSVGGATGTQLLETYGGVFSDLTLSLASPPAGIAASLTDGELSFSPAGHAGERTLGDGHVEVDGISSNSIPFLDPDSGVQCSGIPAGRPQLKDVRLFCSAAGVSIALLGQNLTGPGLTVETGVIPGGGFNLLGRLAFHERIPEAPELTPYESVTPTRVDLLFPASFAAALDLSTLEIRNSSGTSGPASFGVPSPADFCSNTQAQLAFRTAPEVQQEVGALWVPFTVEVEDGYGNFNSSATGIATIELVSGTGVLGGTLTRPIISGIATFDDILYDTPGVIEVRVISGVLQATESVSINVNPVVVGPADHFAFSPEPPAVIGVNVAWPPFGVAVLDASGHLVTDSSECIDLIVTAGTALLSGTTSRCVQGGVATFDDIAYPAAESIVIEARQTGGGTLGTVSSAVEVIGSNTPFITGLSFPCMVPGATAIEITGVNFVGPGLTLIADIAGQIQEVPADQLQLAFGAIVTPTRFLIPASVPYGTVFGAQVRRGASGEFLSNHVTETVPDASVVCADTPPPAIAFRDAPGPVEPVGEPWAPFSVEIQSVSLGIALPANGSEITIALAAGTGTLSGTLTRAVVGSVAVFDDLSYDVAEEIFVDVNAAGLPFPVVPLVAYPITVGQSASRLAFSVEPRRSEVALRPWAPFAVEFLTADGMPDLSRDDCVEVLHARGTGNLAGTRTVCALSGEAVFADLTYDVVEEMGFHVVDLDDPVVAPILGQRVKITGPPAALHVLIPPASTQVAGKTWNVIEVEILDEFGQRVLDSSACITVSAAGSVGTLSGNAVRCPSAGIATFDDLSYSDPESVNVSFSAEGLEPVAGIQVNVIPADAVGPPAQLAFLVPPRRLETAGQPWAKFAVQVLDSQGQLVPDATNCVDLTLPAGSGSISGALQSCAIGGVAQFTGLAYDTVEQIALDLSSAGLAPILGRELLVQDEIPSGLSVEPEYLDFGTVNFGRVIPRRAAFRSLDPDLQLAEPVLLPGSPAFSLSPLRSGVNATGVREVVFQAEDFGFHSSWLTVDVTTVSTGGVVTLRLGLVADVAGEPRTPVLANATFICADVDGVQSAFMVLFGDNFARAGTRFDGVVLETSDSGGTSQLDLGPLSPVPAPFDPASPPVLLDDQMIVRNLGSSLPQGPATLQIRKNVGGDIFVSNLLGIHIPDFTALCVNKAPVVTGVRYQCTSDNTQDVEVYGANLLGADLTGALSSLEDGDAYQGSGTPLAALPDVVLGQSMIRFATRSAAGNQSFTVSTPGGVSNTFSAARPEASEACGGKPLPPRLSRGSLDCTTSYWATAELWGGGLSSLPAESDPGSVTSFGSGMLSELGLISPLMSDTDFAFSRQLLPPGQGAIALIDATHSRTIIPTAREDVVRVFPMVLQLGSLLSGGRAFIANERGVSNFLEARELPPGGNTDELCAPFGAAVATAVSGIPETLFVTDLDGQGGQDVVVASSPDPAVPGGFEGITLLSSNGPGGFSAYSQIPVSGIPSVLAGSAFKGVHRGLAAADLDRDGNVDLVIAQTGAGGGASIFWGTGAGYFDSVSPTVVSSVFTDPEGIDLADMDADGDTDIIVLSPGGISIVANRILEDGFRSIDPFPQFYDFSASGGAFTFTVGDFDQAFGPDIAVIHGDDTVPLLTILLNDGTGLGSLMPTVESPMDINAAVGGAGFPAGATLGGVVVAQRPHSLDSADLDSDGDLDLVMVGSTLYLGLVFKYDSAGSFIVSAQVEEALPLMTGPFSLSGALSAPFFAETSDFDADGIQDVVGLVTTLFSGEIPNVFFGCEQGSEPFLPAPVGGCFRDRSLPPRGNGRLTPLFGPMPDLGFSPGGTAYQSASFLGTGLLDGDTQKDIVYLDRDTRSVLLSSGRRVPKEISDLYPSVDTQETPEIFGDPPLTVDVSNPYTFVPGATDPNPLDSVPLVFTVETVSGAPLPAWLGFNPATGALTGTPGPLDTGATPLLVIFVTHGTSVPVRLPAFSITVIGPNLPPVADAGADVASHLLGAPLTLDGTGSIDPEGGPLLYLWTVLDAPPGALAQLENPYSAMPVITPDVEGAWTFELVVGDGTDLSLPDSVQVVVSGNEAPVAVIAGRSAVNAGGSVSLSGLGSYDPDGRPGPLTFFWSVTDPLGSPVLLDPSPVASEVSFTAATPGIYTATLEVFDGGLTASAQHLVEAVQPGLFLATPPTPGEGDLLGTRSISMQGTALSGDLVSSITIALDGGTPESIYSGPPAVSVPFSVTRTFASDGPHSFTVTATDSAGALYSETRGFAVDTQGPSLVVATPRNGELYPAVSILVAGFANDALGVAGVAFASSDPGVPAPATLTTFGPGGTFETYLDLSGAADGPFTLTLTATDTSGLFTTASVTFTVDAARTEPLVQIAAPANNSGTGQSSVFVSGRVFSLSPLVSLDVGGVSVTPPLVNNIFSVSVSLPAVGANTITVTATDDQNRTGTASVTVIRDEAAPVVAIHTPTGDPQFLVESAGTVLYGATITDDVDLSYGTAAVRLNGEDLAFLFNPGTGELTGTITPVEGPNLLSISYRDAFGHIGTDTLTVLLDTNPPAVTIESPAEGQRFGLDILEAGGILVSGTAIDENGITGVTITVQAGSTSSPQADALLVGDGFSATLSLVPGSNTITAAATDTSGKSASASVTVFYDDAPPVLTLDALPAVVTSADLPLALSGTVTDPSTSSGQANSGEVASLTINGNAVTVMNDSFSLEIIRANLVEGANAFEIVAKDAAGNETRVSVTLTLDDTAPQLVSITPQNGSEGIEPTAGITVTYSEPLDPASVTDASVMLASPEGNIPASVQLSGDGTVLSVVPSAPFGWANLIRTEIGASAPLKDLAGHSAPAAWTSFRIREEPYYLYGQVLGEDFLPIVGAKVQLRVPPAQVGELPGEILAELVTDTNGFFEFEDPPPGTHILFIDAREVDDGSGLKFEVHGRRIQITQGEDVSIQSPPIVLTSMKPETATYAAHGGTTPLEFGNAFDTEGKGKFQLIMDGNGLLTFPDGKRDGLMQAAELSVASIPEEVRASSNGAIVAAYDLQPSGTRIQGGAKLTLPNTSDLPVGTRLETFTYDQLSGTKQSAGFMQVVEIKNEQGEVTGTQLESLDAEVTHFSGLFMTVTFPAFVPAAVAGRILPPNPQLQADATNPQELQGIPGVSIRVVGPSEAPCEVNDSDEKGRYSAKCPVPGWQILGGEKTTFVPLATQGLIMAQIAVATGRRTAYIYFTRNVDFLPGAGLRNINISVDIVNVTGHAQLFNLKACDAGWPGSFEGCSVVAGSEQVIRNIPVDLGEPDQFGAEEATLQKPSYKIHLSSWSENWPVPIPDGEPVDVQAGDGTILVSQVGPGGVEGDPVDTQSSIAFRVANKEENLRGLDLPIDYAESGWIDQVTQGDLFCNTSVYLFGEYPPFGVGGRNSSLAAAAGSGKRQWDPMPLAVLDNRRTGHCRPAVGDGESASGTGFHPQAGVDMGLGVAGNGVSVAPVTVSPSGEIRFSKLVIARPLFGSSGEITSALNKCLQSPEAYATCTNPNDPHFQGRDAEFVRRLNQVRFAPGMRLLAVVHHNTSGYIGSQEIEIPGSNLYTSQPGIRRLDFFDTKGNSWISPARSVRMFPPLVKMSAYVDRPVTDSEGKTRARRTRIGRGGLFLPGEIPVYTAVYRANIGWDHFCGGIYSEREAKEFFPPYLVDEDWEVLTGSRAGERVIPPGEGDGRYSLCAGFFGETYGHTLDSFKRLAQSDVIPPRPALENATLEELKAESASLTTADKLIFDSNRDGQPDVWMGAFLSIDGKGTNFSAANLVGADDGCFTRGRGDGFFCIGTTEREITMPLSTVNAFVAYDFGINNASYQEGFLVSSTPPQIPSAPGAGRSVKDQAAQAGVSKPATGTVEFAQRNTINPEDEPPKRLPNAKAKGAIYFKSNCGFKTKDIVCADVTRNKDGSIHFPGIEKNSTPKLPKVKAIVLHRTDADSGVSTINWWANKHPVKIVKDGIQTTELRYPFTAAHYLIDEHGIIYLILSPKKVANQVIRIRSKALEAKRIRKSEFDYLNDISADAYALDAATDPATKDIYAKWVKNFATEKEKQQAMIDVTNLEIGKDYDKAYPTNDEIIGIEITGKARVVAGKEPIGFDGQKLSCSDNDGNDLTPIACQVHDKPPNAAQLKALKALVGALKTQHGLQDKDIYAHYTISANKSAREGELDMEALGLGEGLGQ